MSLGHIPPPPFPLPAYTSTHDASAAGRLYRIPELRQRVLHLLGKTDLARYMRVEKGCMAAAARELYHTMARARVLEMRSSTERERLYCASVAIIDINILHQIAGDEAVLKAFRDDLAKDERPSNFTADYSHALFDHFVPPLLAKCPNLRRIHVRYHRTSWVVTFDATSGISSSGGRIHSIHYPVSTSKFAKPQALHIKTPPSPSPEFPVIARYNLDIAPVDALHEAWTSALMDDPVLGNVYKSLINRRLPVTLDQLSCVLQRQIAAGHTARLEKIILDNTLPWTLSQFGDFARIAQSSLVILELAGGYNHTFTFGNLPEFTQLVRTHLVNLDRLVIRIAVDYSTQSVCQSLLHPKILEAGGTITHLTVITGAPLGEEVLVDAMRCLSPLVAKMAVVHLRRHISADVGKGESLFPQPTPSTNVLCEDAPPVITTEDQRTSERCRFLRYLRGQSADRRLHLATVNFTALGFPSLTSVPSIEYCEDGRPKHRVTSEAKRWLGSTTRSDAQFQSNLLSTFPASLNGAFAASRQLQSGTETGVDKDTLRTMRELLGHVQAISAAGAQLQTILAANTAMEVELSESIRMLEIADGGQDGDGMAGGGIEVARGNRSRLGT